MTYILLILSVAVSFGTAEITPADKIEMDKPTYGEPIYSEGVKSNLDMSRQWMQILFEDFESGVIPADWTVIDNNADGYMWQIELTSTWHTNAMPADSGVYIVGYDDDAAGSGTPPGEEELVLPAIPSTTYDSLTLIYSFGYQNYAGGDTFAIRVRTHDGASWGGWNNLVLYHVDMGSGLWDTLSLTPYLPADSFQVEFNWWARTGPHWYWYVAVDNVELLAHLAGGGMYDIAVTALNSPPALMDINTPYPVISTFENFGDSSMTFDVHTEITDLTGTVYYFQYDSNNIYLASGNNVAIDFGNWTMTDIDEYIYKTYTMTPDSSSNNDTLSTVLRAHIDFAPDSLISPPPGCDKDVPYNVLVEYANLGLVDTTVDLHVNIDFMGGPLFTADSLNVMIPAGNSIVVNFGQVTFPGYGSFDYVANTYSPFDVDPGNDTLAIVGQIAAWHVETNMPDNLMDHAVVFDGSDIFVLGGYNGSVSANAVHIYSPAKGTWSAGATMPIGLCMYDACVLGDTIYVPGGYSYGLGAIVDSMYKYSISGDNWISAPGTGEPAWFFACEAANGKVYRIGGFDNATSTTWNSTWEYDPSTGGWTKMTNMPTATELATRWVKNDTIYIAGGHDGVATPRYVTQFYDAVNDIWTQDSTLFEYLPMTIWGAGSALYMDTVYVMGGVYPTGSNVDTVLWYDYATNTWNYYPNLVNSVYRTDGIAPDGVGAGFDGLYLFGGSSGGFTPEAYVQASKIVPSGIEEEEHEKVKVEYLSIPRTIALNRIRFSYTGNKTTDIVVRDITGRVIREYTKVEPGSILNFGDENSAGIYFISIKGLNKSKKVTLIR